MVAQNLSSLTRRAGGALSDAGAFLGRHRLLRWLLILLLIGGLLFAAGYAFVARDLPDARTLLTYQTKLPTTVRGIDGEIAHSYARERRVQLRYEDFPQPLIDAYLAAEDRTFFSHGGIDAGGIAGAAIDYVAKMGSDERAVGGSTITQQVAKNVLLSNEYSITRKLREMVLARRIEGVLNKEQILELYLNEIPLGRRSFGVQAASQAYFGKDVGELALHEAAFLAILPKAPERYGREGQEQAALARRNYVLNEMADNGFVPAAAAEAAKAKPLGLQDQTVQRSADAGYFLEEVRRQLIDRFGEQAEDGPYSVYSGGLWVRTSLDPELQEYARDALRKGLLNYHGQRAWAGPVATIDFDDGPWAGQLASANLGIRYKDWRVGVVTTRAGNGATIGFADGSTAPLTGLPSQLAAGDVIAAAPSGNGYAVRTVPEAQGGMVVQDPQTGRVLAMQGGFDDRLGDFNRATQAQRQPGSTIKPFVYAAGLDNGMTPSTQVNNGSYCYYQGSRLGMKCFRGGRSGQYPLRYGLEQSQNVMTVQVAMDAGMPNVVKTIDRMGIGEYEPYPAFALGAGETTVLKLVNAYSALANHGRLHDPSLIDFVQDRNGKVIWRSDERECTGCNMPEWDGSPMPRLGPAGEQAIDRRTAFQTLHMLEGVVTRGTATSLRDLDVPFFGKTGTTTGPKDVWFVGGTPEMIAGAYVGFDQPRDMGGYAFGGTISVPIIKAFFEDSEERLSGDPFVAPRGVRMVRVDRRSGKQVFDGWPGDDPNSAIIWEAFKPDTEPPRRTTQDDIAQRRQQILALIRRGQRGSVRAPATSSRSAPAETSQDDFVEEQGGLY